MKKVLSIVFFCALGIVVSKAQLSVERPLKSESVADDIVFDFIEIPAIDEKKALEEDARHANKKDIPFRFGIPVYVGINFFRESKKIDMPDGSALYIMGLEAPGAKSLNLNFSEFNLPEGATMHVYSADKKTVLGAFTKRNVREDGLFATVPIFTDKIVIEISTPDPNLSGLYLDQVVYGYKDWSEQMDQFGQSGSCNINVVCPEGEQFDEQIRSVILLLTGANNALCTGTMINNVEEDETPYVLSADHCPIGSNNIAIFNYQSPTCDPSKDSSFSHSINGLTILARNNKSDFLLAKLSSSPPANFNAVFSGWDNLGIVPRNTTGIHHPNGDVKKISFDNKSAISSGYYTSGNDHWMIEFWDKGTTEVISSGSPLFDQKRRIVGQLHGGDASCSAKDEEDYYGKFSLSWDVLNDSTQQLKYWLDPENRGASSIPHLIPNNSIEDGVNMGFLDFSYELCGDDSMGVSFLLKNRGQGQSGVSYRVYLNNQEVDNGNPPNPINGGEYMKLTSNRFPCTGWNLHH